MAFGDGLDDGEEVMSDINVTPLVDVMLVLLIIFIIAMPLLTHSIEIDLPRVDAVNSEVTSETITLFVKEKGAIYWDDLLLTEDELNRRLYLVAQQQPQPNIHLWGDRQMDYDHVVKVMAAVQRAGILKLSFVTEPGI